MKVQWQVYSRKISVLPAALQSDEGRPAAANLLRGLIDRIVITTDKATGKPVVDLEGDLAGILSLCHTSKNAASITEDDVSQISLVAGAHSRRWQQGLFQAAA